jgi:superfamily II DNA helicase RecQ
MLDRVSEFDKNNHQSPNRNAVSDMESQKLSSLETPIKGGMLLNQTSIKLNKSNNNNTTLIPDIEKNTKLGMQLKAGILKRFQRYINPTETNTLMTFKLENIKQGVIKRFQTYKKMAADKPSNETVNHTISTVNNNYTRN